MQDRDELLRLVRTAPPGPVFVLSLASSVSDVALALDGLSLAAEDIDARRNFARSFQALYPRGGRPPKSDFVLVAGVEKMRAEGIPDHVAIRLVAARHTCSSKEARSARRRLRNKLPDIINEAGK